MTRKIVSEMTYNVSSGTLNTTTTTTTTTTIVTYLLNYYNIRTKSRFSSQTEPNSFQTKSEVFFQKLDGIKIKNKKN